MTSWRGRTPLRPLIISALDSYIIALHTSAKMMKSVLPWTLVWVSSVCERTKVTNEQLEGGQRGGESKCTRATSKDTEA